MKNSGVVWSFNKREIGDVSYQEEKHLFAFVYVCVCVCVCVCLSADSFVYVNICVLCM